MPPNPITLCLVAFGVEAAVVWGSLWFLRNDTL